MGFPEVPEDAVAFGDTDIAMVRRLDAVTRSKLIDDAEVLRLARVLGAALSRIAEAQVALLEQLAGAGAPAPGASDAKSPSLGAMVTNVDGLIETLADTTLYAWRRQLFVSLGRHLQATPDAAERAVGFADLVGFARLSQRSSAKELARLIDEFERTAIDVVAAHDARTVKLVGDEVMFVADSLSTAVAILVELGQRLRACDGMPDVHSGTAFGPTVAVGGDVFGPTVNLAARLTTIARPGTIVVPREQARDLAVPTGVEVVPLRRPARLKGIGEEKLAVLRPRAP
jgi:adenylate cyclase